MGPSPHHFQIDNIAKIQLSRRKKGNFIQAKLKIIMQEADSQKAWKTVPRVRKEIKPQSDA